LGYAASATEHNSNDFVRKRHVRKISHNDSTCTAICLSVGELGRQQQKPNMIKIMGDDIGIWNIGAYRHGLMAGRTPNIDQLATEGMLFSDYYAEA
jgi:hypothetical protein